MNTQCYYNVRVSACCILSSTSLLPVPAVVTYCELYDCVELGKENTFGIAFCVPYKVFILPSVSPHYLLLMDWVAFIYLINKH